MKGANLFLIAVALQSTSPLAADPRCAGEPGTYQKTGTLIDTPDKAQQLARIYLSSMTQLPQDLVLTAQKRGGIWIVQGRLPARSGMVQLDGGAEVQLCESNGRVLRLVAR